MQGFIEIAAAIALDGFLGDPYWLPHPVAVIGKLVKALEGILRKRCSNRHAAGVLLGCVVVLTCAALAYCLSLLHPVVRVYLLYAALAPRCLAGEAGKVRKVLVNGTLEQARGRLSMLVGRETDKLSKEQVIRATIETTAENATDGVVAPLLFMLLGAPFGLAAALVWAFKAASTLDSMVGYRNDKYLDLGRFSAKLDDALNFVPARIAGVLMCVAAALCGLSAKRAWKTMLRDHAKHESPNSGWTESAAAGALGVELGGGAYYFGKWVEKASLGEPLRTPEPGDIRKTCALMWVAYGLLVVISAVVVILFL